MGAIFTVILIVAGAFLLFGGASGTALLGLLVLWVGAFIVTVAFWVGRPVGGESTNFGGAKLLGTALFVAGLIVMLYGLGVVKG